MIIYKPRYLYNNSKYFLSYIISLEKKAKNTYGYEFKITSNPCNEEGIQIGSKSPLIITLNDRKEYFCYYDLKVEKVMNKLIKETEDIKEIETITYDEFLIREIVE